MNLYERRLCITWVCAHLTIAVIGGLASQIISGIFGAFLLFLLMLLISAVAQDLILRRHLPGLNVGQWTMVTLIGGLASLFPSVCALNLGGLQLDSSHFLSIFTVALSGAVFGFGCGIGQAVVLRPYIRPLPGEIPGSRWMMVSSAAYFVGCTAVFVLGAVASQLNDPLHGFPKGIGGTIATTIILVIGFALTSTITGFAVIRLLKQPDVTSLEVPGQRIDKRQIIRSYVLALLSGLFWLFWMWAFADEVIAWQLEKGGLTALLSNPVETFFAAGPFALTLACLVVITLTLIRALRKREFVADRPWQRYWSMILIASTAVWLVDFGILVLWLSAAID